MAEAYTEETVNNVVPAEAEANLLTLKPSPISWYGTHDQEEDRNFSSQANIPTSYSTLPVTFSKPPIGKRPLSGVLSRSISGLPVVRSGLGHYFDSLSRRRSKQVCSISTDMFVS